MYFRKPKFKDTLLAFNYYYLLLGNEQQAIQCLEENFEGILYCEIKISRPRVYKTKSKDHAFEEYRLSVWELTELNDLSQLENHSKRGYFDHHLDHKYSIYHGYKNGIPKELIAGVGNLRFIPHRENLNKGVRSFIDKGNAYIEEYLLDKLLLK